MNEDWSPLTLAFSPESGGEGAKINKIKDYSGGEIKAEGARSLLTRIVTRLRPWRFSVASGEGRPAPSPRPGERCFSLMFSVASHRFWY